MSELYDRSQAAEYLGCTRATIDKMLEDGRLKATTKINGVKPVFDPKYLEEVKPTLVIHNVGGRVRKQAAAV